MKEVKTKESGNTPKILTDTAKAPKELAKRTMLQAKERARNASQRPETQQDDSPDRYAENRIEQTSEEIAHKAVEGGKNTVRKAKGWDKSIAITAYAETREQSRLIDEYIRNSNTKIKRIIHTK